jgi:hypothetical protein
VQELSKIVKMNPKFIPLIVIAGILFFIILIVSANLLPFLIFLIFIYSFNQDFFKKFLDIKDKKSRRKFSENIIEVGGFNMKNIKKSTIFSIITLLIIFIKFIYYFKP